MSDKRYLTVAETAKLVRSALKSSFPGQSFSVRSKSYSGGASIDIHWTDGPTDKEVKAITDTYEGADFDGSIDLKSYRSHWLMPDGSVMTAYAEGTQGSLGYIPSEQHGKPSPQAVEVHFGADFIFESRSYSVEFLTEIARQECARYGWTMPDIKTYGSGGGAYVVEGGQYVSGAMGDLHWSEQQVISRAAQEVSAYRRIEAMPMAAREAGPASGAATDTGYTVQHDRDWTWIAFAAKPAEAVRETLKGMGARWSSKRSAWYLTRPVEAAEVGAALA